MSKSERLSRGNLIFLFVVAFLAGAIAKKIVSHHIRIGFDDPTTIIDYGELYDIDKLEQKLIHEEMSAKLPTTENTKAGSEELK